MVKRGEIYYFTYLYSTGSVQSGKRPCIIVSNNLGNEHSPILEVVPLTTAHKHKLPTHILVRESIRPCIALCEQITTIPQDCLGEKIGSVSEPTMLQINKAMLISLGIIA